MMQREARRRLVALLELVDGDDVEAAPALAVPSEVRFAAAICSVLHACSVTRRYYSRRADRRICLGAQEPGARSLERRVKSISLVRPTCSFELDRLRYVVGYAYEVCVLSRLH